MVSLIKRKLFKTVLVPIAEERLKRNQCPSCGKPKEDWERSTRWRCCSGECTSKYWKDMVFCTGWTDLRLKAFERDKYRCVKCGFQPTHEETICSDTPSTYYLDRIRRSKSTIRERESILEGRPVVIFTVVSTSKLRGDHITPIALGGEEFNIHNVQTLCEKCNNKKTAKDNKEIAKLRRRLKYLEKHLVKGQLTFN